ncbi:DUF4339 domain-containing protein [Mesorhizobium sp. M0437]|uniref:DUF4339 domain-containing protein n=1 Tax=Mesorhizobium sp. M0437 TaxID=2956945 RepID=UPI00333645E7
MPDWYYEESGAQRGPVSEGDLNTMLANHLLPPNALVWTANLGPNWKPASQTHLEAAPQPVRPPPLPTVSAPSPPLPATAPIVLGRQATLAVPASGAVLSPPTEKWAMWLAFTPLIFLAADIIFASAGIDPYGDNNQARGAAIWSGIGTLWLTYKDAKAINNAGLNPQRRWLLPFIMLMPIGYFVRRRYVAATPLTPLWIWLVSAVVYVMGAGALSTQ